MARGWVKTVKRTWMDRRNDPTQVTKEKMDERCQAAHLYCKWAEHKNKADDDGSREREQKENEKEKKER